ncbi:RNA polymerase sigma factor [Glaciecola siphonariae]|uniref:RNA polymerase sigma factor n=1 Tax=Glaciecola siphonariae TaxID=521012 RepID=A0ABV9LZ35_9ALTE
MSVRVDAKYQMPSGSKDVSGKSVPPREENDALATTVRAAQAGDIDAFKSLYQTHINMVYGLCHRLCADRSQAEDAAQEVFVQVWQKIQSFEHQSKFSTWLHSVASHVCVSFIRKQKGWWQRMFSISTEVGEIAQQEDTGHLSADSIEGLIAGLPQRTRLVFVLHGIEGYRHEQIASMLDISVNTSKVQFHRARTLLEAALNE